MDRLKVASLWLVFVGFVQCRPNFELANDNGNNVVSFFTREKCIDELGCFSAGSPFFNLLERPISLLPDDRNSIDTKFMLYTRDYPTTPMNFSNMDSTLDNLPRSGYNPSIDTKFIVPGYISKVAPHWKMPLKDALLFHEPCNVFYVDWSGGDGPLYEQAVANTRVVGAEIALFIRNLQRRTGVKPQSMHIIGHSLGSHIAGYAGKRTPNLGRITGMDPAGPYFTNVDPVVRLDRSDALFVDAIHTNAAPSRFQGFGMTESIAHFDFFPNGGHVQPGCPDMGSAILEFLKHPSFDADGLHDLMCNHARAIDLFISSIVHGDCQLVGVSSGSWQEYQQGERGPLAVPLGINAVHHADKVKQGESITLYLTTTDTEPFCEEK